jgi:hypothetical protein
MPSLLAFPNASCVGAAAADPAGKDTATAADPAEKDQAVTPADPAGKDPGPAAHNVPISSLDTAKELWDSRQSQQSRPQGGP